MMEQNNIKGNKKRYSHVFQRLKQIRKQLDLTRAYVGEKISLKEVSIAQLENYGVSSTESILDILIFYYQSAKINPLWIIIENNEKIPKIYDQELKLDQLMKQLKEHLKEE